jgi:Protein of unknown function (Hypoth_ymh)
MLNISQQTVVELPIDQLGLLVLKDAIASRAWNELNYVLEAEQHGKYTREASRALSEAFAWLKARALIARDTTQGSDTAFFVTRAGRRVADEGPDAFYATERLQRGTLHPAIEAEARTQFLIGKYELGVFAALKAIEVRVRKLGEFPDDDIGVALMNKAFGPTGPLKRSGAAGRFAVKRRHPAALPRERTQMEAIRNARVTGGPIGQVSATPNRGEGFHGH